MQKTRLVHLYVTVYTAVLGVTFLLFPRWVPAIEFAPGDLVWVRVTGMCLLGYSFFNQVLSRACHIPSMRANVLNQAIGTVSVGALALSTDSAPIDAIALVVLIGFVAMAVCFALEHRAFVPPRLPVLPLTSRWNWYVAGYTGIYGTATGVLPHLILPIVGFEDPVMPWARMSGLLFFVLCIFNIVAARAAGPRPIVVGILVIRIWFVANLIALGLAGYPWFVYASAGIVGTGVVGTIISYRREQPSYGPATPPSAPVR